MSRFTAELRRLAANPTSNAAKRRAPHIAADLVAEVDSLRTKGLSAQAQSDALADLEPDLDLLERITKAHGGNRPLAGLGASANARNVGQIGTKAGRLASVRDLGADAWRDAFDAANGRKNFRAQVDTKAAMTIGLPAVIEPGLTQTLATEPDRLLDHLPSTAVDAPVVEYIAHTGNTNPAGVVAELGTKPDLGMQLATKTATMAKIAALASASMEALNDFDTFQRFVPAELQRAVIDAETAWAVAQFEGISGVLTRAKGASEAPLDTLAGAFNDLRVGAAFATADLVAMHPSTWLYLSTQKDSYGRYLLGEPGALTEPNVWGRKVVTNSKIAAGTALVFDTSCAIVFHRMGLTVDSDNGFSATNFATNAVTYRCEERLAVGLLRPAGLSIVTGLAAS